MYIEPPCKRPNGFHVCIGSSGELYHGLSTDLGHCFATVCWI